MNTTLQRQQDEAPACDDLDIRQECLKIEDELMRLMHNTAGLPECAELTKYFHWLNESIENPDELFVREYLPIIRQENAEPAARPFLTVITRTQGKRPEMLRETLLSMAAQTDEDFELLLIGHKLDKSQKALIDRLLWELPSTLRSKLRFFPLDYGTRTTPLNFGFAHARGEYAAILDDDDIVMDNWVESFHACAEREPGRILHAYVLAQKWMTVDTDIGVAALRACAKPELPYCRDFNPIREIESNVCPPVGLAFPTFFFHKLGIIFDESLTTTEDWDFLMRTSFLAGVSEIREPTGVYRLWTNAENSATVHAQEEWVKNYRTIQEKFREMPVLLPGGEEKVYIVQRDRVEYRDRALPTEELAPQPLRPQIKERLRTRIPRPLWWIAKKLYRLFGGKKWLG